MGYMTEARVCSSSEHGDISWAILEVTNPQVYTTYTLVFYILSQYDIGYLLIVAQAYQASCSSCSGQVWLPTHTSPRYSWERRASRRWWAIRRPLRH